MTNKFIIVVLTLFLILGVYFIIQKNSGVLNIQVLNIPSQTVSNSLSETFEGTLPCADCSGLETVLTLTKNSQYAAEGTYTLSETYVDKVDKPLITKGYWTTIKGTPKDPSALIYQLTAPDGGQPINYLLVNSNTLELVDQNFSTINSPFNLTLTLKK